LWLESKSPIMEPLCPEEVLFGLARLKRYLHVFQKNVGMSRYIRRPAIVAMLTSGCILMNTARVVSRTSVMLGIDGLPATGPKSGSFPAVPLIRFDKFRGKTVGFAL